MPRLLADGSGIGFEHRIHASLVAFALSFIGIEYGLFDAQRHGLGAVGLNQAGVFPKFVIQFGNIALIDFAIGNSCDFRRYHRLIVSLGHSVSISYIADCCCIKYI